VSTILEIESAVQKLPLAEARRLHEWLRNYLHDAESSLEPSVADTWEKLGPAPAVDLAQQ
jgi:hypothetical protein